MAIPVVWRAQAGSQQQFLDCPHREVCYSGTRGPGKALPFDTPVLTPRGWKRHGDLKRGDVVMTPSGDQASITHVFQRPQRQCYRVTFDDGAEVVAADEHLWKFRVVGYSRKAGNGNQWHWDDTDAMRAHVEAGRSVLIPTVNPLPLLSPMRLRELPLDPYVLGLLLGDGCFTQGRVLYCTVDDELAQAVLSVGAKESPLNPARNLRNFTLSSLKPVIAKVGLKNTNSGTKFVPQWYKFAPVDVRVSVLQGLMDTDGSVDAKGYIEFTSISKQLALDVQWLARSLGAKATLSEKVPTINGETYATAYRVYMQPAGKFKPFRLQRKAQRVVGYMHHELCRRVVSIEPVGVQDCNCIHIDHPDHLYVVTDGFIVTHNTDAILMAFAKECGKGYGMHWRGIIFRKEYKHLDDIVSKSKRWFNQIVSHQRPRFLSGMGQFKWIWPDGEELLFRAFPNPDSYWSFHGHEYPFVGFEELTGWPSIECYESMMSCNRSSFQPKPGQPKIPLMVRSTTNPYGVGHNWVKAYFIDPAPYGVPIVNSQGQKRVTLFGSVNENKFLDQEYVKTLNALTDPNKRKAWLFGSWDITSGGMFDDLWNRDLHVLPRFVPPATWRIDRSFDWGSSHPFSVGWWAESDGLPATVAGVERWFPRGTLIRMDEWYGCSGKPNEGLRLTAQAVANGIVERETRMRERVPQQIKAGPADSSIYAVTDDVSIAQNMAKAGVRWTPADKKPGSRKNGWELIRVRLEAVVTGEDRPGMYVMDNCRDFLRTVPPIARDQRDPDDVDTEAEDHIADEVRYRCLAPKREASSETLVM